MKAMTRSDRQTTEEDALEILRKGTFGVLSTMGEDGQPYGTPFNYVLTGKRLYFHCALRGHTLDNILQNRGVCFTVVPESKVVPEAFTTKYESAVVFGEAVQVEGSEKTSALMEVVRKYSPDFVSKGEKAVESAHDKCAVVRIDIVHLTGKKA